MTVIAKGPASPAASRPETLAVDLAALGLLPPLPSAYLAGRDLDLLAPLRFLAPGTLPAIPVGAAPVGRRELAGALGVANRGYGHPAADELARRLADPATRVVVTGQQPGLFGGPLYGFAKMVAAGRWAAALEAAGEPAVAVFWVATEDHDYAEVASAAFLTPEGPRAFDLGPDPEPLVPVGMRTLGPEVTQVLAALAAAFPGELHTEWFATLGRWYRPDARFGEAFCRLLAHLLGPRCPLLLDAMHPALKAAERPLLRRLVERRHEIEAASEARDAEIERRGHLLQVSPQRGSSPLFLFHRGERRRIEWRGEDGFALRGRAEGGGSVAELLRTIDENPGVVSPGVLARPAVQDAVLGTCLQVLGPGEVSYMAQVAPVYPLLEVAPPTVALRPQTMVLEAKQIERLAESGLTLADLLGARQDLDRTRGARAGGGFVAPVRQEVEAALATLRAPALGVDPNLERPWEKTREQILRALDLFADKAISAAARRDEVESRRVEQLRQACLPFGKLQERALSTGYFGDRFGPLLAESFWEQMELDPLHLQVISPGREEGV
jgi:bacillithiol biosynthesis cysteine-adding enzyme BshC